MRPNRALAVVLTLVVSCPLVACGDDDPGNRPTSAGLDLPSWPAPEDPVDRTVAAGLEPLVRESLENHRHSHLDVFVDGEPVTVPAGIGIDITDPGVKHFPDPAYGGIEECAEPCISPLHTHDETGILHTESPAEDLLTLGQFFTEWDVRLDERCAGVFCGPATDIAFYLDGERTDGDPAEITLDDRRQIAIVIGTPPASIPATADFSRA